MPRKILRNPWVAALQGLSWPLLIGAAACSIFYVLINQGPLKSPFMYRYFASHPVLYFETGMFFVGLAALVVKAVELVGQSTAFRKLSWPELPDDASLPVEALLDHLAALPNSARQSYLGQRLTSALEFLERQQLTVDFEDELKYLADQDAARQQDGYSLVRIVAWATPMLGFLGTVIGITQALGDLDPKQFATDMNSAMQGLLSGLYVAFDTTALALVLSMILMFIMYFEDRIEAQILAAVDSFVIQELAARCSDSGANRDPYLQSVERMSAAVIKTTEALIRQQTEHWRSAMAETNEHLGQVASQTGEQVRLAIAGSLEETLKSHAERLAAMEADADRHLQTRWEQWQAAVAQNVQVVRDQQAEISRQTELLSRVSQAASEVTSLETALNHNLNALAGAKNFEDTVLSLSAAIQLLSTRLSGPVERPASVELRTLAQGKAA